MVCMQGFIYSHLIYLNAIWGYSKTELALHCATKGSKIYLNC